MWIRLTRKLADCLDGIDVADRRVGDVFDLPTLSAHLLISEGWAELYIPALRRKNIDHGRSDTTNWLASEASLAEALKRLSRLREQASRRHLEDTERRRLEDRIRQELRDERSITITPITPTSPDPDE